MFQVCTQRTLYNMKSTQCRIQAGFNSFTLKCLCTQQTPHIGFVCTIVNRALSSLHGGSLEITLTVPLTLV